MFLTVHKLASRIERIEEYRYFDMKSLFPFTAFEDLRSKDDVFQLPAEKGEAFTLNQNDFLTGRDRYFWLEQKITLPEAREGFDIALYFDLGRTGGGFTEGFEAVIYVDDVVYQGVDHFHKEVLFDDSFSGKTIDVKLLLWSGLNGASDVHGQLIHAYKAEVGYAHKSTTEFCYLANMITKIYHELDNTDVNKEIILKLLDKAVLAMDIYDEPLDFYPQVDKAYATLLDDLEAQDKNEDVTVHLLGHSHIDVAWLWRIKHSKEKCMRSFSTVLRLMNECPEYCFTQSQPQLYAYVKEYCPELFDRIKEMVKEGRFEPNGGMWVEADCNLISGESMARQFIFGEKFINDEFGLKSNCLWLPDVFGYSHAMPQVLKLCDIDTFMTTKISWNEYNKIPHDTFFWRGMDGSEVLTHFITTPNEGNPDHYTYFTYNGYMNPATDTLGVWKNYKDKAVSNDVAISFGYGDGGGGPSKDMIYCGRMLNKIPSVPNVVNNTARNYFNTLWENVKNTDAYIHTWCRELYFENHRGTYTSQAYNKLMNRTTEYALAKTETLGVLSTMFGGSYNASELEKVWKLLLVNQFHDIIPGSSIHEVYEDSKKDYAYCTEKLAEIQKEHLSALVTDGDDKFTVFNPSIFSRDDLVFIPCDKDGSFTDENGNALASQKAENGYFVKAHIAPLSFANIVFVNTEAEEASAFAVNGNVIETPYYSIEFAKEGYMTKIFDKINNRDALCQFANRLNVYEDIPIQFDAWNIDYDHYLKSEFVDDLKSFTVKSNGSLVLEIDLEYAYRKSTIKQTIKLYANDPRIDFVTNVDWHESHKLLKAEFDVNVFSSTATYDIQFGNVVRNTHHSNSWDWGMFEVCGHKWADISEYGYGVSLLNNCKYGHSIKDNRMCLSLIKSATWPDATADQGEHNFTYALLPHAGDFRSANIEVSGTLLNTPLVSMNCVSNIANKSLFTIDNNGFNLDTVKLSEDKTSAVIRVHEYMGGRGEFTISSDFKIKSFTECNILERDLADEVIAPEIKSTYTPYQIKTYKVKFDV